MWKKRLKNVLWISLLLLLIGIQVWEEAKHPQSPAAQPTKSPPSPTTKSNPPEEPKVKAKINTKAKAPTPSKSQTQAQTSGQFDTLIGGRLHEDRNNDGDSFKIFHEGKILEFRLYFVDAPEKRLHQYNGERLDHQGRYFGQLKRDQTISIGQKAKAHTEQLLTSRPFRVVTRWQPVFESSRFYAFVFFEDTDEELSESLTRQGLCRIYTEGTNLPDGRKKADFERHLKKIEAEAKQAKRGGWGLP